MGGRGRVSLVAASALLITGCTTAHRDSASKVRSTWLNFFSTSTSVSKREQLVESGAAFAPLLQAQARGGAMSVVVDKVVLADPTHANVSFSLSIKPSMRLDSVAGAAVFSGGLWRVSKSTLCVVLAATGQHDPACA
jgi:PBP1b-binding outer membrane lipoprotein LpoB